MKSQDASTSRASSDKDTEYNTTSEPPVKKRTRCSSQNRPYVCGCGKSYQSYPAIYTHAKNKHAGHITEGSYHLKNGEKKAIKSSRFKCVRTGSRKDKFVSGRLHFQAKASQNQKVKDVKSSRGIETRLKIPPIDLRVDSKLRLGRQGFAPGVILSPSIYSLLDQNNLRTVTTSSSDQIPNHKSMQTNIEAVLKAINPRVFLNSHCCHRHIQKCLEQILSEVGSDTEYNSKSSKPAQNSNTYQLFSMFLVFFNSYLGDDPKSESFLSESIQMVCLLCQALNTHGEKEERKVLQDQNRSSEFNSSAAKTASSTSTKIEQIPECKGEQEYCANPNNKLKVLKSLMPRFLGHYFPIYWSHLLKLKFDYFGISPDHIANLIALLRILLNWLEIYGAFPFKTELKQ